MLIAFSCFLCGRENSAEKKNTSGHGLLKCFALLTYKLRNFNLFTSDFTFAICFKVNQHKRIDREREKKIR